jgi:hypothetical protein
MKGFLVVLTITLGLNASVSAQEHTNRPPKLPPSTSTPAPAPPADTTPNPNAPAWAKFTSEEGRFSVFIPGTPKDQVETTPSNIGPYTTHLFTLRNLRHVFLIGYVDYDPSFNFNPQAELDANRDQFVKNLKATLVASRNVRVDGYSALEFTAVTPDERVFKARVYIVGRRPYLIVLGSPKGVDDTFALNRFFSSFKITR